MHINIKKNNLYIDTISSIIVLKYLGKCPLNNELVFSDIVSFYKLYYLDIWPHYIGRRVVTCPRESCDISRQLILAEQKYLYHIKIEVFEKFLYNKSFVEYNRLNSIIYLKKEIREKLWKLLNSK